MPTTRAKPKAAVKAPTTRRKAPPKATVVPARGSGRKLRSVATDPPAPGLFDLETALKDMPDNFLQCRDYLHSWRPYGAKVNPDGTYESTLRCNRCTALKVRVLSRHGTILSAHYDYPDGYTMAGSGRLDGDARDRIRLRSVMKQINLDTVEDAAHA